MSYLSIYRKYRPDSFEGVVGQDHIVRVLSNQIISDRISHAYIFTGSRGTGKTSVAKIFARLINCENSHSLKACGKCQSCIALANPNNLDIIEMDAASNNGVDEIRDIRESVKYPPTVGTYKVYIIDEVHMLTSGAWNALLKTLEEPPSHVVFILATTEAHKIPQTIISRCMQLDFRLVAPQMIAKRLKFSFDDMAVKYDEAAIAAIAEAGEGSVRDAQSVADMCLVYAKDKITYEDVLDVLGASSPAKLIAIVQSIFASDISTAMNIVEELASLGKSMSSICKDIIKTLRNLFIAKSCSGADKALNLPKAEIVSLIKTTNYDNQRVISMIDTFASCEASMRYSKLPRILLENAIAKCSEKTANLDYNGLLIRIKALESGEGIAPPCNASAPKIKAFEPREAMGLVLSKLAEDNKLFLAQMICELDTDAMVQKGNTLTIEVADPQVYDSFIKLKAIETMQLYLKQAYNIVKVEMILKNSTVNILADIEYVKAIMGTTPVRVVKK